MDWMQHALMWLGVPLALLIVVIIWALIIFVIVDETIGLFTDEDEDE